MAEIMGFDTMGVSIPTTINNFFGGTTLLILILVIVIMASSIGIWLFINWRTYNKKIIIFENIAGQGFQPVFKDSARLIKIGDGGEELLYLKKKKTYKTAYGKKMGKNTYWFARGQDGYDYNILLGDLDAKMGMLDIEPVDRDLRYMNVAIRKSITERFRKIGFMEKYGATVVYGVFFIIVTFALWLLIDQIGQLLGQAISAVEASGETVEYANKIISKLDAMSGGSGITIAT